MRRSELHQSAPRWSVVHGDCIALMAEMDEGSVDAIVTDPPYGLEFMGKAWDRFAGAVTDRDFKSFTLSQQRTRNVKCPECERWAYDHSGRACECGGVRRAQGNVFQAWCETWGREALRVLKPGGYLLAFGGTRTYHRLVSGLEDAGFEVRDQIAWIYGSGFPKHKACLKPAQEPIVLARKASRRSVPLQIDAARVDTKGPRDAGAARIAGDRSREQWRTGTTTGPHTETDLGRWPANVALDEEAAAALDEQSGTLTSGSGPLNRNADKFRTTYGEFKGGDEPADVLYGDTGGASRFFYVAKPDGAERHVGLAGRNPHPTVKPVALMRWLCRLITPPGGTVLDPFTGSGTTGIAAMREGFSFTGLEQDAGYVDVARARIIGDAPLINGASEAA